MSRNSATDRLPGCRVQGSKPMATSPPQAEPIPNLGQPNCAVFVCIKKSHATPVSLGMAVKYRTDFTSTMTTTDRLIASTDTAIQS